jgi:hypothetical protein
MRIRPLFIFVAVLHSSFLFSQNTFLDKYLLNSKIGIGTGLNFYVGSAGDGKITAKQGNYTELKNATDIFILTKLNATWDIGLRYTESHLWSLFANNEILAFESHAKDIQVIANKEITPNFMNGTPFNLEAIFGLGFAKYHAKMYSTDKNINNFSTSIGYGRNETNAEGVIIHEASERNTFLMSSGLKLNYNLFSKFNLFLESRINLTTTSRFSGNMYKKSSIPPDAFWSNLIGIELSLGQRGNSSKKIGCPRFY